MIAPRYLQGRGALFKPPFKSLKFIYLFTMTFQILTYFLHCAPSPTQEIFWGSLAIYIGVIVQTKLFSQVSPTLI